MIAVVVKVHKKLEQVIERLRSPEQKHLQWLALAIIVVFLGATLTFALLSLLLTSLAGGPFGSALPSSGKTATPAPYVAEQYRVKGYDGCDYLVSRWSNNYYTSVPVDCTSSPQPAKTDRVQQMLKAGDRFAIPVAVEAGERIDVSVAVRGNAAGSAGRDLVFSVHSCDGATLVNALTIVNGYFQSFAVRCSGYYLLTFEGSRTGSESLLDVTINYRQPVRP